MVVFLIGVSNILGWVMSFNQIPQAVSAALLGLTENRYLILLIMNLILLAAGTFMDVTPAFLIFTPLFLPVVKTFGMSPIQFGLILVYTAFALGQGVFLFVAYYKSIPLELEEAAIIDGCSTSGTFFRIVFPLAKPMTITVVILDVLWIWNDFMLPLLLLNKSAENWTLPLYQYNFKSSYTFDYNLAFASFLFSIIPMMIVYICLQKYIIAGLTAGAVKG